MWGVAACIKAHSAGFEAEEAALATAVKIWLAVVNVARDDKSVGYYVVFAVHLTLLLPAFGIREQTVGIAHLKFLAAVTADNPLVLQA